MSFVGGAPDHTHILRQLGRTSFVADLVKNTKRSSSIWVKDTDDPSLDKFAWQNGYGAFSIGQSQVEQVKNYIRRQDRHHRRVSFQDEFREFLRRYEVDFDERYVWD
jgi:putative transposase